MRLGILAVVAVVVVLIGTPQARAERSEMAWMFAEFERNTASVERKRRTARVERTKRVRVASLESDVDVVSDAQPERRRMARTERRQRVRVASIDRNVEVTSVGGAGYYSAGPRPGKWCGWWMRTQRGGGPEFNVAWNWRKYGSPTVAQIGAVVIWRHHVGEITGQTADGRWIVRSGNDGGRVRERARSVAGAIFRI
jgi:hypothetical protein